MERTIVRRAEPRDASGIHALVCRSFDDRTRRFMTLAQPNAVTFLEDILSYPRGHQRIDAVAVQGGRMVGYADFRISEDFAFLSHICVSARSRGEGIGRLLISWAVANMECERIGLDVFCHNTPAWRLYENLGFEPVEHFQWWTRSSEALRLDLRGSEAIELMDPVLTRRRLARYGSCWAVLKRRDKAISAGVIGETLKLSDLVTYEDDHFIREACFLFPEIRYALHVVAEGQKAPRVGCGSLEARSARLEVMSSSLKMRLRATRGDGVGW